jgi:hypothetical protein
MKEQTRLERMNSKNPKKACNSQSAQKSSLKHSDTLNIVEVLEHLSGVGEW